MISASGEKANGYCRKDPYCTYLRNCHMYRERGKFVLWASCVCSEVPGTRPHIKFLGTGHVSLLSFFSKISFSLFAKQMAVEQGVILREIIAADRDKGWLGMRSRCFWFRDVMLSKVALIFFSRSQRSGKIDKFRSRARTGIN